MDDDTRDPDEDEKDTRLKFKPKKSGISALQAKMLKLAGQDVPKGDKEKEKEKQEVI